MVVPALFGWIFICFLVAWFAAQYSPGAASGVWYESLERPSWNPPAWVFGPVWTILYTMMGISAWLVWKDYGFSNAQTALSLFLVQLILNGAWSYIFFGLHSLPGASVEILFLLLFIGLTIFQFYKKSKPAAWLLVPYFLWVAFASVLTFAIWSMN
ncbi:MAG TPA: TspO/MBR family protein [Balneolaceae bacterium]|nr:TspO/MBR family protein [Balneolaceae bacterium]